MVDLFPLTLVVFLPHRVEVPVYYDKLNCRVMFDATTCNFVITYRRQPWKNCPVYDQIGDVLKDPTYQPAASPSPDEEKL